MVGEYDSNNLKNQFTFKVTFNRIIAIKYSKYVSEYWSNGILIKVDIAFTV